LRRFAEGDQEDDGHNADDDAEGGEQGAHPVLAEGVEGRAERLERGHRRADPLMTRTRAPSSSPGAVTFVTMVSPASSPAITSRYCQLPMPSVTSRRCARPFWTTYTYCSRTSASVGTATTPSFCSTTMLTSA